MPRKPNPLPDDPEQSKRFMEIAREVGADGTTREEFNRVFKKIVSSRSAKYKQPNKDHSPKKS
jgi:hypothetical protein